MTELQSPSPMWTAVRAASGAVGLPKRSLLHAGPPFTDPYQPSAPVLSSAVLACRHEGWSRDDAEAEAMILDGRVRLRSAHDFGVVTPLAEVVSPRTPLMAVMDANDGSRLAWSPLASGPGPQMRFGTRNAAVLDRHTWRDDVLAPMLSAALRDPIDLVGPARAALDAGEDLHSSTATATAALARVLDARLPRTTGGDEARAMLAASPLFFLTLWMAACRTLVMALAEGRPGLIVAMAGNGHEVGIRLAGQPQHWITAPASPPEGPRMDPSSTAAVSPMIGDSGVIDAAGFGGQRSEASPARGHLLVPHAGLGTAIGLDAGQLVAAETPPIVHIGMIAADGVGGLLGRGVYRPPLELFRAAITDTMARTIPT